MQLLRLMVIELATTGLARAKSTMRYQMKNLSEDAESSKKILKNRHA